MGWINDSELCYRWTGLPLIITSDYMQHSLILRWLFCCIFSSYYIKLLLFPLQAVQYPKSQIPDGILHQTNPGIPGILNLQCHISCLLDAKNLDVWQVSSSWLKQKQNYPSIYVASSSLNIHVKVSIKFWESFCIFYYILVLFTFFSSI